MLSASARLASSIRVGSGSGSSTRSGAVNALHRSKLSFQRRTMGGDMPVPQSQTAPLWHGHTVKNEGWETTIYFYYAAGLLLQAAVLLGAPETSIESWARPEAQARLVLKSQIPNQTFEFGTHYQDLMTKQNLDLWSQFAAKAITPGEDDDDDDEEDEVRNIQTNNVQTGTLKKEICGERKLLFFVFFLGGL